MIKVNFLDKKVLCIGWVTNQAIFHFLNEMDWTYTFWDITKFIRRDLFSLRSLFYYVKLLQSILFGWCVALCYLLLLLYYMKSIQSVLSKWCNLLLIAIIVLRKINAKYSVFERCNLQLIVCKINAKCSLCVCVTQSTVDSNNCTKYNQRKVFCVWAM